MKKNLLIVGVLMFYFSMLSAQTPWLHVDGNKIKDPLGNVVILHGLAVKDIQQQINDPVKPLDSLLTMLTDTADTSGGVHGWYPHVVRFTINPGISDFENYYTSVLKPSVDYATRKGLYVIIDNHFVSDVVGADQYTQNFWTFMAPKFRNYSNVFYELFNEPIDQKWSWAQFKPYMQNWVNIVRKYAPNNLILAGSPIWSQEMGDAATDSLTGGNIAYVAHVYPPHFAKAWNRQQVEQVVKRHPVFMTEWGFGNGVNLNGTITGYGEPIMKWADSLGISWTAWIADNNWQPNMFDLNWNLLIGEDQMGGFVKLELYSKRNDDRPDSIACAQPYLGIPRTLCGDSPLSLNSGLSDSAKVFSWYKNDTLLANDTTSIVSGITTPGMYKVKVDSNGCVMHHQVAIIDTLFPVYLGPNQAIIKDSITLIAADTGSSFTFRWYRNSMLLSDTMPYLKVYDTAGTVFSVKESYPGCGMVSDTFKIVPLRGPYRGIVAQIPGKVEAENFDFENAPNISYYDTDAGNDGGAYRNEQVDIEPCSDVGGGYDIGYIAAGEWEDYTVNVTQNASYNVIFRVASLNGGGQIRLYANGKPITSVLNVPITGGWQTWQDLAVPGVNLSTTDTLLRISMINGGFNLNYVEFTAVTAIIPSVSTNSSVTVFPNPVTDKVIFAQEGKPVDWKLLSLSGTEIASGNGTETDMSALTTGIYILLIEGEAIKLLKK